MPPTPRWKKEKNEIADEVKGKKHLRKKSSERLRDKSSLNHTKKSRSLVLIIEMTK